MNNYRRYIQTTLIIAALISGCGKQGTKNPKQETLEPPEAIASKIPWDFKALNASPEFRWLNDSGQVRSLLYQGEQYRGKTSQVFAYYASPATMGSEKYTEPFPAVVLVHGGGGTAFSWWVKMWAEKGYAAIAMDLNGSRPAESLKNDEAHSGKDKIRLPNGGPLHSTPYRIHKIDSSFNLQWQFHAISNVIRAHSLIRDLAEVDEARTALTGISWGGYLSNMVAGLDNRFNCVVPVYGCGFIHENSYWTDRNKFKNLSEAQFEKWVSLWDPAKYVVYATMPMLFINGTNDPYYYLEIFAKTVRLTKNSHQVIKAGMKHGHGRGARPDEIFAFIGHHLKNEKPLPEISKLEIMNGTISAEINAQTKIDSAFLVFTKDTLHPKKRKWEKKSIRVSDSKISAESIPENMKIWYLSVKDARGLLISSGVVFDN